jgi:hypothetical protein
MASVGWAAALLAVTCGTAAASGAGNGGGGVSAPSLEPARIHASVQELTLRGPEPAVVEIGGEATLTLSLDGIEGEPELVPPAAIEGLEVRIGPPQRSGFQTVTANGVELRARTSWRVALVPAAEGRFELPPFEARCDGLRFASRAASLECVRELEGERFAFVEVEPSPTAVFVRQRFELVLRLGIDEEFLDSNLLQLFARELDVPLQVEAAWIDELPGAERMSDPDPASEGATFALGERVVRARPGAPRERDGRRFAVWELETSWIAARSGELVVPAPLLRFAWASRFDSDLVAGRRPVDRRIAHVRGEPARIDVEPLPEGDRPSGFTGAVGTFSVSATASPTELAAGESLRFELRIRGDGALEGFAPPRPPFDGFDVRGELDHRVGDERVVTYDLSPRSPSVSRVPAAPFSFFDPAGSPPQYRTVWTEPIALTVAAARAEPAPSAQPSHEDPAPSEKAKADTTRRLALLSSGGLALVLIVAARRARRRRASRSRTEPSVAARRFGEALERGDDPSGALASYLASRLGCAEAAVIGPDLRRRLEAASVGPELAQRAARALEHLVAARFGDAPPVGRAELDEIVRALESAWPPPRSRDGSA